MKPKPIVVNKPQESLEETADKYSESSLATAEARELVAGVLADMRGANPRIYQINVNAYERWRNNLARALELMDKAKE